MNDFKFDLQLFGGGGGKGGGGGSSSSSSYEPSEQEKQIMKYMAANATNAQGSITPLLNQFSEGVQNDNFKNLLGQSSNLIQSGQSMYGDLAQGKLPTAYTENMTDAIKTGVNNTVGANINSLANRGVLNSSVTNKALNDVEGNVANAMAQSYNQNVSQLGNLAGQQIQAATAGYQPYSTLAQLAQGQANTFINSPVSALRGSGTTAQKSNDGSNPLVSTALGLGTAWAGAQMGIPMFM